MYILNGTSGHAEIYKRTKGDALQEEMKYFTTRIKKQVAVGFSIFPDEVMYAPRWWTEATVAENITYWIVQESGGHFAATEKPQLLIDDIRKFTAASNIAKKIR